MNLKSLSERILIVSITDTPTSTFTIGLSRKKNVEFERYTLNRNLRPSVNVAADNNDDDESDADNADCGGASIAHRITTATTPASFPSPRQSPVIDRPTGR